MFSIRCSILARYCTLGRRWAWILTYCHAFSFVLSMLEPPAGRLALVREGRKRIS